MNFQGPILHSKDFGREVRKTANRFGDWLRLRGVAVTTIECQKGALRSILKNLGAPVPSLHRVLDAPGYDLAASQLPDWQQYHLGRLSGFLNCYRDDCAALNGESSFTFAEINPWIGTLSLAALKRGGFTRGGRGTHRESTRLYQQYFGRDPLLNDVSPPPEVILVNLPFSVFTIGDQTDPELQSHLDIIASEYPKTDHILFRVDWSVAERLELPVQSYLGVVKRCLPKSFSLQHSTIRNDLFTSMGGSDLYIAASRSFSADFFPVFAEIDPINPMDCILDFEDVSLLSDAIGEVRCIGDGVFPRFEADYYQAPSACLVETQYGFRRLLPPEMGALLGVPISYPFPSDENLACQMVAYSAVAPSADRALLGFLRSIGMLKT